MNTYGFMDLCVFCSSTKRIVEKVLDIWAYSFFWSCSLVWGVFWFWGVGVGSVSRRTNRKNKGLISVDRSNKATLLLTIPRSILKSSTMDLSLSTQRIKMR